MSTDLEHDLRAAFDELAATTTVSANPRFGDVTTQVDEVPRHSRLVFLTAAAAVVALVGGLAVLVRDRGGDAPAPAATTAPSAEPAWFLFPDATSDVRYDDPRDAVDAYLADRVTTSPPGQTVTFTVNHDDPPFDSGEDRVLIGFTLTVTPDDPSLCCDSGDGRALVVQADGVWFVEAAQTVSMHVENLSYSDDGVVEAEYSGTAGGMYTAMIDTFGYPGPEETGFSTDQQPLPEPGNNANFRSPGHTAPAVAVRFWHAPTDRWPNPSATFAEFIVPKGTDDAATISVEPPSPETTEPPAGEPASSMLSDTWMTPSEAAEAYLATATDSTAELVSTELLAEVPSASIEPNGRLFAAPVSTPAVVTLPNEVWFRFELIGSSGTTDGIIRVVDTGWPSGTPAWAVSYAGTRGVVLASATYDDRLVQVDVGTTEHSLFVRRLDRASAELLMTQVGTRFETGLGADAPPTVAVTLWSKPGAAPAFAEKLVSKDGESQPIDFGALLDSMFGPDVQVTVPSFVGLTEGQARALTEQFGLVLDVGIVDRPAGDPLDATVTAQGLAPGSVTVRGTTITVTLAQAGGG